MLDLLIITGASKGIGKSVASNLLPHSKIIVLISSSELINDFEDLKISRNHSVFKLQADISNFDDVLKKVSSLNLHIEKCDKIGLVFCASQLGSPGGILEESMSEMSNLFNVNTLGNLNIFQFVIKKINSNCMLRAIFFAGGGAAYGYPDFFGYSLSKVSIVRVVENLAIEIKAIAVNTSIIALAPGAVATDMLAKVIASGGFVKTQTKITEPVNFVKKFLFDEIDSKNLNGRFLHVRDNLSKDIPLNLSDNHFKLRRIE